MIVIVIVVVGAQRGRLLRETAISLALSLGLIAGGVVPSIASPPYANANAAAAAAAAAYAVANPAIPEVSVLISGPPIKDPGALLRYALPIDNKAIREVQKPLEDITDSLKISGLKALDSVERVGTPSFFTLYFLIKHTISDFASFFLL